MTARPFNKNDRCRHRQGFGEGTVVRYYKPTSWRHGVVIWKGWDSFNPERIDWTWDFAMEKVESNEANQD